MPGRERTTVSETATDTDTVVFELERFERSGDGRLEVGGRWFGVRGRGSLRPTLSVLADGGESRSLATMEHKPWTAADGESWEAAFPADWDSSAVVGAELAVAPDLVVSLPAATAAPSAGRGAGRGRGKGRSRFARAPVRLEAHGGRGGPGHGAAGRARRADVTAATGSRPREGDARLDERATASGRRGEQEQVRTAQLEAASAIARRDAALGRLSEVTAERDAARVERDETIAERDRLAQERTRLRSERDRAISARDAALAQTRQEAEAAVEARVAELRAEVERERSATRRMGDALRQRDLAQASSEAAGHEREIARRERDEARRERDHLLSERDAARRERNQLLSERDAVRTRLAKAIHDWEIAAARDAHHPRERDAARAERDRLAREREAATGPADGAPLAPAAPPPGQTPDPVEAQARRGWHPPIDWLARALALAALITFVVVFVVLVRSA